MGKILNEVKQNKLVKELVEKGVITNTYALNKIQGRKIVNIDVDVNKLENINLEWGKFRIPTKEWEIENTSDFVREICDLTSIEDINKITLIVTKLLKLSSLLNEELESLVMGGDDALEALIISVDSLHQGLYFDISINNYFSRYETIVGLFHYGDNLTWTTFKKR